MLSDNIPIRVSFLYGFQAF